MQFQIQRRCLLLGLLPVGADGAWAGSERVIVYPVFGGSDDPFGRFCVDALRLAVERCGEAYSWKPMAHPIGQSRAIRELAEGLAGFNLMRAMTSAERERQLLPVRLPLDRGLMGWRLLLVRRADQQRFAKLRSFDDLRELTAGQIYDWPDTTILRANGLQVGTASQYYNMFTMLQRGRIDYFPRSVLEIEDELAQFGSSHELAIAPGLMLRYPTAMYFFVSPREPKLADDLRRGLERALADGSLRALFLAQMRPLLRRLGLGERTVLSLKNPLLPEATPLGRAELWEEPGRQG
ncbi:substrate-binding periplasmic protein [Roseateles aquae]|nr:ABC transporter substrate-binding protein [Paucibacter sp. APW11]